MMSIISYKDAEFAARTVQDVCCTKRLEKIIKQTQADQDRRTEIYAPITGATSLQYF